MSETVISLVAVGRNDNYGGDFHSRLQSFVSWSFEQLTKAKVRSEIIFVNYNPLLVEGPIEQFIEWPTSNEWVKVRVITVPPEVHAQVVAETHVKNVPVLEYVAKNVGISRANGKFILAMNPDILMSESLFQNFHRLSENVYYRANRLDHNFEGTIDHSRQLYDQLRSHVSTVWFQGSHTDVKGFSSFEYMRQWFLKSCQNLWRRNTVYFERILNHYSIPVYYHNIEYRFHCNAGGDFMLMDRQSWYRLKGYKQSSYISLHVDSLMVLQAAFAGLKGTTFFGPIYHRQHERRYDAINKETEDQRAVYENYKKDVEKMDSSKSPVFYNDENWGLAYIELPEKML
jgi:hypothetical protein